MPGTGRKQIPVAMTLEKNMPIGSGLGSSACSVVAALMAMNETAGKPLNDTRLLALMGELGRPYLRQHSLRQRGTVFSRWYAVDDRRKTTSSASKCQGLMSGCGCWRIRGLKSRRQKPGRLQRAVSPPGLHCARATIPGRLHSRLLFPSA